MSTPVLELRDVHKAFGAARIIQGAELAVARGERHAVIGPNGAGKSTLFNLISGMFTPSSGEIRLAGRRIDGLDANAINRLGLSRSFQITNVFARMSVFENIRIGVMARHGIRFDLLRRAAAMRAVNEQAQALVERVRLAGRRDTLAGDLAYSEQRALEIGMTLSTGAEVILLDEPTAGMSREETAHAVELMRDLTKDKTLLVVEHDMDVVFGLCDRISVLVYGKILATGTPAEIRADRRVQEAYLGEEAA
ncbi:ABC transporter ATP-binding protein [Marinimicrococcus flavescens]|uniref:ABC transporter ATP-binding protein n=1 Tax=Marinimicrococcus flavescens TaxID=3031815 RepID=A0AAP3UY72_9PROT|nr:ABC transporter ATP-binding protein [Marinimicrococcus flavescens]